VLGQEDLAHAAGPQPLLEAVLAQLLGLERLLLQGVDAVRAEDGHGDARQQQHRHVEQRRPQAGIEPAVQGGGHRRQHQRRQRQRHNDQGAALPGVGDEDAVDDDQEEPAQDRAGGHQVLNRAQRQRVGRTRHDVAAEGDVLQPAEEDGQRAEEGQFAGSQRRQ
jgi:hypothetical protein